MDLLRLRESLKLTQQFGGRLLTRLHPIGYVMATSAVKAKGVESLWKG
jgi:hypothetical protein